MTDFNFGQKPDDLFFDENEQRVNRKVMRIYQFAIVTGPAMILATYLKIFPAVSYTPLLVFTALHVVLILLQVLFSKKFPYSHKTKYFYLACTEVLIIFLAITPGLCLFISYLIVPLIACMYYDKKFTHNVTVICYFVMIASIGYRSTLVMPEPADGLKGATWFAAYGVGATIEYFVCMLILYNVTKTARETLDAQIEQDHRIRKMQSQLITSFANFVESKDSTTGEHIKRTSTYVYLICIKMRDLGEYVDELTDEKIEYMVKAAPLHDLGKMEIPENILDKPGKLTKEEFDEVKMHPVYGEKLIRDNMAGIEDAEYTKIARMMALYHHENWDGSGYPMHLRGSDIPLPARIMSAADVLDALLSARPYKPAFPLEDTISIMNAQSGTQFDPLVIKAVNQITEEIRAMSGAYQTTVPQKHQWVPDKSLVEDLSE